MQPLHNCDTEMLCTRLQILSVAPKGHFKTEISVPLLLEKAAKACFLEVILGCFSGQLLHSLLEIFCQQHAIMNITYNQVASTVPNQEQDPTVLYKISDSLLP